MLKTSVRLQTFGAGFDVKTGDWSGRTVQEAGADVEDVDGLRNQLLQIKTTVLLLHGLLFTPVNQSLVDARVLVSVAL